MENEKELINLDKKINYQLYGDTLKFAKNIEKNFSKYELATIIIKLSEEIEIKKGK
jgi:hypothetical protein